MVIEINDVAGLARARRSTKGVADMAAPAEKMDVAETAEKVADAEPVPARSW
jgi:hypothetical protein